MSHRPSISGKISRNRPVMWIHTKEKLVDRVFPRSRKKGPLTYGPIRGEKWSRTHIHQEVMVPCVVRNGPNTYPNIDTYPPIYRPGRSVTVDIDGRCRFTNGRIRSIFKTKARYKNSPANGVIPITHCIKKWTLTWGVLDVTKRHFPSKNAFS